MFYFAWKHLYSASTFGRDRNDNGPGNVAFEPAVNYDVAIRRQTVVRELVVAPERKIPICANRKAEEMLYKTKLGMKTLIGQRTEVYDFWWG